MTAANRQQLLVLTSSFPRWVGDTDPRFVEELCFELARDYDVTVLAPHCQGANRRETLSREGLDIDVERYRYFLAPFESLTYDGGIMAKIRRNPLRALLVPLFLAGQLLGLARLHRERRFAAIHAHWLIPQGIVAAFHQRLNKGAPPFLVTAHGSDLASLSGRVATSIKRAVLARAAKVAVVSEALREDCEALGCDPAKIVVGPMGVDLQSTFTPGNSEDRYDLVYVGKLVDYKGVENLIEAMGTLATTHPEVRLTIVGDGDDRARLEQQAHALGVAANVTFAGALPQAQIPAKLQSARIAVLPSLREGLGLVVVEALGCGCAVVASDLPAVRDIITDEQTGLLVRPGDATDLARQLGRLLDDPALAHRLADAGRAHALANFDWRAAGNRYADELAGLTRAPTRDQIR